jgi:hypothetical protein
MAISVEQLNAAAQIVAGAADVRAAAAALRQQFAPLRTLVVDAIDMRGEEPVVQLAQRAIYLMSTDGHCWTVTPEPAQAQAFVLTQA